MPLLFFDGPPALSPFRRAALLDRCRQSAPRVRGLEARFLYMAWFDQPPAAGAVCRLGEVLGAGAARDSLELTPSSLLVTPRPGTISPWSSKATDIAANCGASVDRLERGIRYLFEGASGPDLDPVRPLLHDRMIEAVAADPESLFARHDPRPLQSVALGRHGREALEEADARWGLALSPEEIDYLADTYLRLGRDPTDVELVMFANVNSEHCRHKIFNASWVVDGQRQERSLFDMIRHTHASHPEHTVKAYSDNSGVIEGFAAEVFRPDGDRFGYRYRDKQTHILCKVETHNHPTAISPWPGASTGVGGEIRDEGATGAGARSQAGLCAFYVSHLRIPGWEQPWEAPVAEAPGRLATPLQIMTDGPLGGAAFGNEFGRPNVLGLFRTFEQVVDGRHRGYHKPIMVAGGSGLVDADQVEKAAPEAGDAVVQIGGPALLIGLGGSYASSMDTGSNLEELDFASVQRDNPEMQRRCQELIDRCAALGGENPIRSIHDVGAGGLSNACPELVEGAGAAFDLRAIPNDEPGMSPMELWSNEAQERYVLVVGAGRLERFREIAGRERCPIAVIGRVTGDGRLTLEDPLFGNRPVDGLPLEALLGKPPRMVRDVARRPGRGGGLDLDGVDLAGAAERVLRFPAVAAKSFLISIADRTVGGCVARDQMVGRWQVPVSDCAATLTGFRGHTGAVMAMGERTPVALVDGPAAARLAVAEAVTNLAAAPVGAIEKVKLSANWMCACGEDGEDAALFDTVRAVGLEFCPALGVSIPVGKDSLSMRAVWSDSTGRENTVAAPLSLVVSAFAPVTDVRGIVTPELKPEADTRLLLVDLGHGRDRLGGSCLAQVHGRLGEEVPDVEPADVRGLFAALQRLLAEGLLLACHDRSDGGLFVCAAEMAFAGRRGVRLRLAEGADPLAALFSEEIGVLVQVRASHLERVRAEFAAHGLDACVHDAGSPVEADAFEVCLGDDETPVYREDLGTLEQAWSELSYRMADQRDDPGCAREAYEIIADRADPGLTCRVPFDFGARAHEREPESTGDTEGPGRTRGVPFELGAPAVVDGRPPVAILREQGVNGQVEMAAAFDAAGCRSVDVTMTDLLSGRADLADFAGLAACGGFSYGDVLGAGAGWARTILFHDGLRRMFEDFFARGESFALGVCNGCQMLSLLSELIPGAEGWPRFTDNRSGQFEARLSSVEILPSSSVLLRGMEGARLPVAVAHGEGRAEFDDPADLERLAAGSRVSARFVDGRGAVASTYPANPNGSPEGVTALSNADGRVTIMMPHPERVFRVVQLSWRPPEWEDREFSPWLRMFENAKEFAT
ncbi:MAG: phosphoribosylformylglycinamidine synthase [Gemmatimonadaceae bacterium]|nr:phosphoribosylformylglycinamidine synthase [Gemmatimonadaceae bacterium]